MIQICQIQYNINLQQLLMNKIQIIKIISKIVCIIIFTAAFLNYVVKAHLDGFYFKKTPITPLVSSIIGLLITIQYIVIDPFKFQNKTKKFIKFIAISNILLSAIAFVSFIIMQESASMALSIFWLLPNSGIVYSIFKRENDSDNLLTQNQNSIISQSQMQRNTYRKNIYTTKTHVGRCKCCAFWFLFIFTFIVAIQFCVLALIGGYRYHKYQPIGKMVLVKAYPNSLNQQMHHKMRIYCQGPKSNLPIFLLEHGGGSNGISFFGLQQLLTSNGRRSCSYDRSGYGRSQNGPNDINPTQAAQKTYELLNITGEFGTYIILGWSAGAQISQVFAYTYPLNTSGLIFVDGYPDYRALQAIKMNKSDAYVRQNKKSLLSILDILRGLQPVGSVQVFGVSSQFKPKAMKQYYQAYYKNGYTWNSQYNDIRNPYDITAFLTDLGDKQNSTRPYNNSSVSLNWPRIKVPVLILPASSTVGQVPNQENIYYRQCLKYNQTSENATISVLNGTHGIVYQNPQLLVSQILKYFS